MDPKQFFTASRLIIVAGKGGVGKTTVTAALASAAADEGLSVLAVEVEPDGALARCMNLAPSTYDGQPLRAGVYGRSITADQALRDYLHDHGLKRLGNRLFANGTLDVIATAAPGIEDILVLGKVKSLEKSGDVDLIVLDAPAAGHAITFLQSAAGLADAVSAGPISTQARDVLEMLGDPERCQVILVTLAEETPVNEAIQTAYALEERVGVSLGPVVVNGCYASVKLPAQPLHESPLHESPLQESTHAWTTDAGELAVLESARRFRCDRMALQESQLARLSSELALAQLRLPFVSGPAIGPTEVALLSSCLRSQINELVL